MTDLSHWDFADRFSGYEAAALILGLEPRESETEQYRIRVITDRMCTDYLCTRMNFHPELDQETADILLTEFQPKPAALCSVAMENLKASYSRFGDDKYIREWRSNYRKNEFDKQDFSRDAIVGWLRAVGMQSVYQFEKGNNLHPNLAGRWPWGNHHTEMLGHLEAAARRFWVNYDPADSTTAETNATVSEWLQTERGVSKTMSDSIASMLRPDGLPTGPRK